MSQPDGGAAFPIAGRIDGSFQEGMSLRDFFAGMALQGMFAANYTSRMKPEEYTRAALQSYITADAMIAQREAQP